MVSTVDGAKSFRRRAAWGVFGLLVPLAAGLGWVQSSRVQTWPLRAILSGHDLKEVITGSVFAFSLPRAHLMVFSPDSRWLATGGDDGDVRLWDLNTMTVRATHHLGARVEFVGFASGRRAVVAYTVGKDARLWDVETGHQRGRSQDVPFQSLERSPDGKSLVVTSSDDEAPSGTLEYLYAWLLNSRAVLRACREARQAEVRRIPVHLHPIGPVWPAPDGRSYALSGKGPVSLRDVTSGRERAKVGRAGDWFLAFSPDSKLMAVGGKDRIVSLCDIATGQALAPIKLHAGGAAFSPDGRLLATSGLVDEGPWGGPAWLTRLPTSVSGFVVHQLGYDRPYVPIGEVIVWDLERRRRRAVLRGHRGGIQTLSFAPDGRTLATGGSDNTIRLWAVR